MRVCDESVAYKMDREENKLCQMKQLDRAEMLCSLLLR
jgi:hypothetical protein